MINLKAWTRAVVPRWLLCSLRFSHTLLSLRGHSRRDRQGFCVDRAGQPIPWLTYPLIDFLENLDFSGCRVFEFGSGSSTFWWVKRCQSVTSVEMDADWNRQVQAKAQAFETVTVIFCPDSQRYPQVISQLDGSFDVIVIDGAERDRCAVQAVTQLHPEGLIVLDNVDWYPQTARFLRESGLIQIDFYGFCPLNSFPSISSLFFRPESSLVRRYRETPKPMIGGVRLPATPPDDRPERSTQTIG